MLATQTAITMAKTNTEIEAPKPVHLEGESREELDAKIAEVFANTPEGFRAQGTPLYNPWKPCFYCDITFVES